MRAWKGGGAGGLKGCFQRMIKGGKGYTIAVLSRINAGSTFQGNYASKKGIISINKFPKGAYIGLN